MVDPFEFGVLHEDVHGRLVQNLTGFARAAGIAEHYIYTPLADFAGEDEIEWARGYGHRHGGGLLYTGTFDPPHHVRMAALAGTYVRNFVDARVVPLVRALKTPRDELPSVLLIPDMHEAKEGALSKWQVSDLVSLLHELHYSGRELVFHVHSLDHFGQVYGAHLRRFLEHTYSRLQE